MRPASPAERERLNETFAALCRIESPTWQEDEIAGRLRGDLEAMGLAVEEDDFGNLLARIPGRRPDWVMLCAHMDTVALTAPVEPVVVDGGWENANDGILGADNKAAVAVLLEVARRASIEGAPVGIELLLTRAEEVGLRGAAAFDRSRSKAAFAFVFDHATPIGEVIVASPTLYDVRAEFRGKAAHAGLCPEHGRNAIVAAAAAIAALPNGRLDDDTTVNVGGIQGGSGSTNVVAERCTVAIETRSIRPARVEEVVAQIVDALHDGANATDCDVDITSQKHFDAYRHKPSSPALAAAEAALRACGHEPRRVHSGGGSDANAFEVAGLHCVNLANGTERAHEPTERVAVAALETMLDVTLALVSEAAERIDGGASQ
jgi:tripeptide aminopeptidase